MVVKDICEERYTAQKKNGYDGGAETNTDRDSGKQPDTFINCKIPENRWFGLQAYPSFICASDGPACRLEFCVTNAGERLDQARSEFTQLLGMNF